MDPVAREPVCVCVSVPVMRVLQLNGNTRNSPKLVADLTPRASDRQGFFLASPHRCSASHVSVALLCTQDDSLETSCVCLYIST